MRHFSCDICGKDLTLGMEARYVVSMEVSVVCDSASPAAALLQHEIAEDTEDAVEAMDEILASMDDAGKDGDAAPAADTTPLREYDLCGPCYRRFAADPLGRERSRHFQFSAN